MNKRINKYKGCKIEDFVWDDSFRKWVLQPTEGDNKFWKDFLLQNDKQAKAAECARQIIMALTVNVPVLTKEEIDEAKSKIYTAIQLPTPHDNNEVRVIVDYDNYDGLKIKSLTRRLLRMVAVLIPLFGVAFFAYRQWDGRVRQQLESGYGSIKKLLMPDSSVIVLNANSKIEFRKNWNKDEPREVWLDGEAYFKVKHIDTDGNITPNEKFLVHTKNVTVEVMGTSFDVRCRRGKTIIVLETGSIRLSFVNGLKPDVIMRPGQMVYIDPESTNPVVDSTIEAADFSAWTKKQMMLTNAPLKEILQYLEDNYGKQIVLKDQLLYNRKLEGVIMLDNLDDALFVLSKVLNVNVIKQDSIIYFKPM